MIVTGKSKPDKALSKSSAPLAAADDSEGQSNLPHQNSNRRLFWSIVTLLFIGLLSLATWYWWDNIRQLIIFISDQQAFGSYLQSFGILGPLVLFAAQLLQVFVAFIPGHVVLIAAGYVYGFALGLLFNITFTVAASQLAYLVARWAGRPVVYRLVDQDTVEYWERIANQKGVVFFTITFLLPIFPSDAMNFVAGLSGIDARRFLIANFVGRFPSAVLLTLIGAYGWELTKFSWALIILAYILFFILGHFAVNKIRQSVESQELADQQNAPAGTHSE